MDDWGGWAQTSLGAVAIAALANVDRLFGLLKGWRAEKREAAASVVEGAGAAVDVMKSVMEAVNTRLKESEAECERRMELKVAELRDEFDQERRNMRALIRALALKLPLDAKLKRMLDEIAPEAAHG